jgi:prolyl-tRNA editing enzyme YbaK/EbsC (Cys-tRNA(Pro) deacylase)
MVDNPDSLRDFLESMKLWHRFIEFNEPVKTVEQAKKKVPIEKIAKSIVLVDYDTAPLLAILPAKNRVRFAMINKALNVKDVRLATPEETLKYSGYAAGGVPPFNKIQRVLLDPLVLENETSIVGGGNVNRLVEVRTQDIVSTLQPIIVNIVE